jgi:hypothetical protein
MNYPDCRFIEQQYRLVGNDTMADELIVHSHRFVTHVTDLLRLTITLHNSYNAYRLLERIERQENITGNPALWEVRNHFAAASTFELADRILVSVMRYIHHKTELQQMAAMAHFSSTRNIINAWITQQHGSSWKQFEVTMQPWRNFMSTMEKIKGNPVTLSDQDIQYVNFSKIEEYIAGIEAGKVVESSAYYAKLQLLKERLLQEKAQGNVEILQLLERLEAFR